MTKSRLLSATLLGAAVLFSGSVAQADPLFDFSDPDESGISDNFQDVTLGYTFSLSGPVTVDGIGLFDYGSDGLSSAHEVALWDSGMNLIIAPVILNPGSPTAISELSASGLGSYIYEAITELVLGAGDYVLGASYLPANGNKDPLDFMPDTISTNAAPDATFGAGVFGPSSGVNVMFPMLPAGGENYFGPQLRISSPRPPTTIPEPLSLALLVIGLVGTLGMRRQSLRPEDALAA
jgi:hypothetical protein